MSLSFWHWHIRGAREVGGWRNQLTSSPHATRSRLTAKKFLAAANFLEILTVFGDTTPEVRPFPFASVLRRSKLTRRRRALPQNKDKIKYSKWKAADIAKAFREGRTPVPGPAGGLPAEDDPTDLVASGEVNELTRELAALEAAEATEPTVIDIPNPEARPTAPAFTEPAAYPFPQHPTTSFLSDADDDEQPVTPAFPSFLNTPTHTPGSPSPDSSSPTSSLATPPASHQTSILPAPPIFPSAADSGFPAAVFPSAPPILPLPPPAPVVPRYVAPPPAPYVAPPVQYSAPPPPPPVAPVQYGAPAPLAQDTYDPSVVSQIQKHAKWAVSALNYDDYDTARKELRIALGMLGG